MDGKVIKETLKKCFETLGTGKFKDKNMLTSEIRNLLSDVSYEDERDWLCEIIDKFDLGQ
ncbi:hypothetical protein IJT10_07520 [bacterium]|nr:hypothetical protein [bacterium]